MRHIGFAFQGSFVTKMLALEVSSSESHQPLVSDLVAGANDAPPNLTGGSRSQVVAENNSRTTTKEINDGTKRSERTTI
jgi:hypothetical protein